jgi:hypothetical protein
MGKTASLANIGTIADSSLGFRNRLINGGMTVDQRNAGASSTPSGSGYVTVDRFAYYASQASKITIGQNLDSVTPPSGFRNYLGLKVAATATVGASDYFIVGQPIEGYNVADLNFGLATAATVTISFWVRSSVTGTFGGYLKNASSNRSYPFTYAISAANTWEQKSITVAGDTTGTWGTTNGQGLLLYFGLGVGSSLSFTPNAWGANDALGATGATSIMGTSGATFYITGVQLEKGSTATSFDYRPIGTELQLAQRYYQQYDASENGASGAGLVGVCGATNTGVMSGLLPVAMRTTATVAFNNLVLNYGAATVGVSSITVYSAQKAVGMDITTSSSPMTVGRACVLQFTGGAGSANKITYSAEL